MNNLILGYGLLGKELVRQTKWDYICRDKDNFDFYDINSYVYKIYKYETIVNCIAYTNTYENNKEKHLNINYKSVLSLSDFCMRTNKKLIHISTDYVYANSKENAKEEDPCSPVACWYAVSKLLTDEYLQAKNNNHLIIRTSFKPNPFPYNKALTCQIGNFDYVNIITSLIIKLINKNAKGIYNVGTESKTIYDLAIKTKPNVIPCDIPINSLMPKNVTMDINKMKKFLEADIE
jgi:dTDP-4-dehydrorhamnose reductase